jgi:hypothetical protein
VRPLERDPAETATGGSKPSFRRCGRQRKEPGHNAPTRRMCHRRVRATADDGACCNPCDCENQLHVSTVGRLPPDGRRPFGRSFLHVCLQSAAGAATFSIRRFCYEVAPCVWSGRQMGPISKLTSFLPLLIIAPPFAFVCGCLLHWLAG